ncbi:MAG: hypothetical protein ABI690_20535 [Chloroflexota bacterium]
MSKKALIVIMAAVLAVGALSVMAQDGPGVININLPDGKSVPVFTDGRLNAFDLAAPVVVYYTAANGSIVNPDYTSGTQPDLSNLNFTTTADMNLANTTSATTTQPDSNGLIDKLEVLAIDPATSNGDLVLNPTVDDLLSLVSGSKNSIAAQGYSVNFDPKSNYFWVQSPANFEGKVYTFAWPNNLFPLSMVGQHTQTTVKAQASAQPSQSQSQVTPEPTQAQNTTQPTAQPTASA